MRRALVLAFPFAALLAFLAVRPGGESGPTPTPPSLGDRALLAAEGDRPVVRDPSKPLAGPDRERWFFDDWHGPDHGPVLDREVLDSIWSQVQALPSSDSRAAGTWSLVGASGMTTAAGALYSGRILDMDWAVDPGTSAIVIWLAAASGGLWEYDDNTGAVTPRTDALVTQAVGTVSVDPNDLDNIVIGTGEHWIRAGAGVFRSTDRGVTWTQAVISPSDAIFHRIRHVDSNLLLGISDSGTHRSTNGGATWSWITSGTHFDLSLDPTDPNKAYTTVTGGGTAFPARTTDGGLSWSGTGFSVSGYRGSIAVAPSSPNIVYAAFGEGSGLGYALDGIYKSTDGGATWATSLPGSGNNYMGGQGWYNNVISVDPTDANTVYAGGVGWKRTTDGGASWGDLDASDSNHMHPDFHSLEWIDLSAPTPGRALGTAHSTRGSAPIQLVGQDGGFSFDNGSGYNTVLNYLPITQYTHVHGSTGDLLTLGGGSQDNGISITTDGGSTWFYRLGGDGSDVSVDPNDSQRIWCSNGVYSGALTFRRKFSTDQGLTWADKNVGIAGSSDWYTEIANDQVDPVWLYTNAGAFVYSSDDYADTWTQAGSFSTTVRNLEVARYDAGAGTGIYATLESSTSGARVWIYDFDNWFQRDAGLPIGAEIRSVIAHPVDPVTCFALVNGIWTPGEKIYRSTDRGVNWTNITGNLPDVPLGAVVAHPTDSDKIYLGTEMGCFETADGGSTWQTWNTGMPTAAIVCDMTYVDRLASDGDFYVIAGTYGRSMYRQKISGIDPTAAAQIVTAASSLQLAQNVPNPHPGNTRIAFNLPKEGRVRLAVYDVAGRKVATLADGVMPAGRHITDFQSVAIAPGVYFYRLETHGTTLSRKMIIVR